MLIRCPECHFERTIDAASIPANAAMATCPHCQCRFRFRNQDGTPVVDDEETPSAAPAAAPSGTASPIEDDPLPPGAVVPHIPPEASVSDAEISKPASAPEKQEAPQKPAPVQPRTEKKAAGNTGGFLSGLFGKFLGKAPDAKGQHKERVSVEELRPGAPASAATQEEKKKVKPEPDKEPLGIPWEQVSRYGYARGIYQTILQVMFSGPRFFSRLSASYEGLGYPLAFYVVLGMFQTLVDRMWYLMKIEALAPHMTDPQEQELLTQLADSLSLPMTLILTPGILAIQLFFFSGLFYLMFRLVQPEQSEFRTVFRVIAYSAAPTVVCIVPFVGPYVSSVWFAVSCFIGCKYALRLPWSRTMLALGPLYLVSLALGFQLAHRLVGM